jgi:chromosome partitioning protein
MQVWSIANQKGGVGKTTTTVTLAGLLSQKGNRVLVVDLDPQASLTCYFGYDPDVMESTSFDWFQKQPEVERNIINLKLNLDLIPASPLLATLEQDSARRRGYGLCVSRALSLMYGHYDYVLLDCPPTMGLMSLSSLAASEVLILPVQTDFLAIKGLVRMARSLDQLMRVRRQLLRAIIIPTMHDPRIRASVQSLRIIHAEFGDIVANAVVPLDSHFRNACADMRLPNDYKRTSRGVQAYDVILERLSKMPTPLPIWGQHAKKTK